MNIYLFTAIQLVLIYGVYRYFFHTSRLMLVELRKLKHYMVYQHMRDPDLFNIWLVLYSDSSGHVVYDMHNPTQREIRAMQLKAAKINLRFGTRLTVCSKSEVASNG